MGQSFMTTTYSPGDQRGGAYTHSRKDQGHQPRDIAGYTQRIDRGNRKGLGGQMTGDHHIDSPNENSHHLLNKRPDRKCQYLPGKA